MAAATDMGADTTSSLGKSRFCSRSIVFKSAMKQMSSKTTQDNSENEEQHLLRTMIAAVFPDFKRRPPFILLRDCVMSLKQRIERIEMRMQEVQELFNFYE